MNARHRRPSPDHLVALGIGAGLLVAALRVEWSAVAATFGSADSRYLALAVAAVGISTILKGVVWKQLVEALDGVRHCATLDAGSALFACGLVNGVTIGNLGEVAKLGVARRRIVDDTVRRVGRRSRDRRSRSV